MSALQKNVASQIVFFGLVNATTGAPLTGATLAGFISKDSGAQASTGGTYTGLGNGQYSYAPTQAETNANAVGILHTATGAVPVSQLFYTIGYNPTAAVVPANATQINGVATTSVTTINANVGTTQPINYSGIGSSAFVKSDTQEWAGSAVQAPNVAGTPIVDLKYILGTPSPATAGSVRADAVTGAVGSVTGNVGGSVASVAAGGLTDLTVTTYGEPSGPVGATATLKDIMIWLKTLARNKITQTSSTQTLFKDDGSTSISTSADSDDGTTFTRGKWS